MSDNATLKQIPPRLISRNPDNPRVFFRAEEIDTLMSSISRFGIQVPLTVYREKGTYVLIDGERRWRCAKKLNLKTVPALIQKKPTALHNLLLMFNIHALREQWDYFTIANKLPKVIELFLKENDREPNEIELSELTGLSRGQIRRCRMLIDLPEKYKSLLIDELSLPKQKQVLSEDFFIEMERSLKAIEKRFPELVKNKNKTRDILITKYRDNVIENVTDFRKLSKIATSVNKLDIEQDEIRNAITSIFDASKAYGINQIFEQKFESRYDQQKVYSNVEAILDYLHFVTRHKNLSVDSALRKSLVNLRSLIDKVLES